MSCKQCASDLKSFNGEVAIHFPGREGLDKPIVWVFPRLMVCLHCGLVEFMLPNAQIQELKNSDFPRSRAVA
jgi:hypothetical protein